MSETYGEWWESVFGKYGTPVQHQDNFEYGAYEAWHTQQSKIDALAARYDDAMKRIQDMQAELEFLRAELARKA